MAEGTTAAKPATSTAGANHHGWCFLAVGFPLLLLYVVVLIAQVQTSEIFILHSGQTVSYIPNFDILMQIPNLFIGHPTASEASATIFGWGIELFYLAFALGFDMMRGLVLKSGKIWEKVFLSGMIAFVGFNFWADFSFGSLGDGLLGHALFAAISSFVVAFGGYIGVAFVEHAWKRA